MKKFLLAVGSFLLYSEVHCSDISLIHSDSSQYVDDEIHCKGNVLVVYNKKVISADKISFSVQSDVVEADGNVIIKDELGNIYLADRITAQQNFKAGHGDNVRIISCNKTRLAARKCDIIDGKYELEDVIFSPCYECTQSGALTWQIKSKNVTFDPEDYTEYNGATLEFLDTPILYAPYFAHVSSNVKRKSGFLVPMLSASSQQGISIEPTYLVAISDSQELILKPLFTSKIGHIARIYYGLRFPHGEFDLDTSITGTKSVSGKNCRISNEKVDKIMRSGYRGHIFSKLRYELDNNWRVGFDANLASDRYYLKRFVCFENPDRTLESSAYLEGFDKRNYTLVKSSMFQSEYMDFSPHLLPIAEHNHFFELFGGTLAFNMIFMNMDFKKGRNSQKYVLNPSWSKEILLPGGHLLTANAVISLQGLRVSEVNNSDYDSYFQALPQLNLKWRWPLVIDSCVCTPIAGITLAGNKKHFDSFENPFDEINETNLFSGSKSISPYNIESGQRYFYGIKLDEYGIIRYRLAVGQSVELTTPVERLESSGMKYRHSDWIGSFDIFVDNLTFSTEASYSQKSKDFNRLESGINYTHEDFSFGIMGFRGKQCFYNPFEISRNERNKTNSEKKYKGIMLNANYKVNGKNQLNGEIIFGNNYTPIDSSIGEPMRHSGKLKLIKHRIGLNFENECAKFMFQCERINKSGGDLRPETNFKFIVQLKQIG